MAEQSAHETIYSLQMQTEVLSHKGVVFWKIRNFSKYKNQIKSSIFNLGDDCTWLWNLYINLKGAKMELGVQLLGQESINFPLSMFVILKNSNRDTFLETDTTQTAQPWCVVMDTPTKITFGDDGIEGKFYLHYDDALWIRVQISLKGCCCINLPTTYPVKCCVKTS